MQIQISRALFAACLALLVVCLLAACDDDDSGGRYSASEPFSFTFDVANRTGLQVIAINGFVRIDGKPETDSVEIRGERIVRSEISASDAAEHLAELIVQTAQNEDSIVVQTEQTEQTGQRYYTVLYNISVPQNWQINVGQANGNIMVSSLHNDAEIDLVNGNVEMDSISGNVEAGAANGNMRLRDISGSVIATLVNGNIDGKIILPSSGTCELGTVNGEIILSVPEDTSASFSARVGNGKIRISGLSLSGDVVSPKSVDGKLGHGDGSINLQTTNGNIEVTGF